MNWSGPENTEYFLSTHPEVYIPSDDTFLLAKAVHDVVRPGEAFLEVGCGAGLVAMVAARRGAHVTCTDLNPHAVRLAGHNAKQNGLTVTAIKTDLLDGVAGPFDVVAFNPPYLPTAPDEVVPGPLNLAFDGGLDGNQTVLRFAAQVLALRPLPASILVVHSSLSDPGPLTQALAQAGYRAEVATQSDHFFERLRVLRFQRP